jgi:hypothetical protein
MKELRVLVPFADGPVLAALLPESSPLLDGEGKGITRKPTEKQLSNRRYWPRAPDGNLPASRQEQANSLKLHLV